MRTVRVTKSSSGVLKQKTISNACDYLSPLSGHLGATRIIGKYGRQRPENFIRASSRRSWKGLEEKENRRVIGGDKECRKGACLIGKKWRVLNGLWLRGWRKRGQSLGNKKKSPLRA